MCRICGIAFKQDHFATIDEMTDLLAHGGPDDRGIWHDETVALGHRRLAIMDLSLLGHQPMLSASGRYVIVYNGEIYNFLALRNELKQLGCLFVSDSDTEVVLAACEIWGLEVALNKFNGMFAFALWDRQEKCLYLARDRFGEKPLYYGLIQGALVFASELKAIVAYPEFERKINRDAVQLMLRYAYIPAPYSIYQDIFKLEPGYYLKVQADLQLRLTSYWSAIDSAAVIKQSNDKISDEAAIDQLDLLLTQAVANCSVSDVPLGIFLSGGIDSSLIASMAQKNSTRPMETFSIGFEAAGYNEAVFAQKVAKHLGAKHHELYISEQSALDVIPTLAKIYDEPFADSSQIPTYLVSRFARQHVKVALSGDAADELFGGYNRYFFYEKIKLLFSLPKMLKYRVAMCLEKIPWALIGKNHLIDPSKKLASILYAENQRTSYYEGCIAQNYQAEAYVNAQPLHMQLNAIKNFTEVECFMLWDILTYLPGDILTKVDRASMAVGLEVRAPFLALEIFEFSQKLALTQKIFRGQGKYLLRKVLYRYVPQRLVERPKAGFGIPIHAWLRGSLKAWVYDLLDASSLKQQGFLNVGMVQQLLEEHMVDQKNRGHVLWNVLMFQAWLLDQR